MQTPISTLVQSYSKTSSAYKAWGNPGHELTIEGLEGYPLSRFLLVLRAKNQGRLWALCPTEDSAKTLLKDYERAELGVRVIYLP
ncbi:MAG: hypothetical protein RBQ65_02870, partial [Sphaerochaeta sp.]|nr:hypothetical protein [Sphaerochaeta sp.]